MKILIRRFLTKYFGWLAKIQIIKFYKTTGYHSYTGEGRIIKCILYAEK